MNVSKGQRFAYLVVTRVTIGRTQKGVATLKCDCVCDCGKRVRVTGYRLLLGRNKSCGCKRTALQSQAHTLHGRARSIEYRAWQDLKHRCLNPHAPNYDSYGGRGITVCKSWRISFDAFSEDMGRRPVGMSIDRRDNNGGYWCGKCDECMRLGRPSNCRWATCTEQNRNKRVNAWVTHNGKTMIASDWDREIGLGKGIVSSRIRAGWSVERALTAPYKPRQRKKMQPGLATLPSGSAA